VPPIERDVVGVRAGAYAASFDLGGLARYGADLRTPVAPIRFSSSDLAGHGYQHVDGAIRMGHRTAAAILADLGRPDEAAAAEAAADRHLDAAPAPAPAAPIPAPAAPTLEHA
jgi:hypothetical protein